MQRMQSTCRRLFDPLRETHTEVQLQNLRACGKVQGGEFQTHESTPVLPYVILPFPGNLYIIFSSSVVHRTHLARTIREKGSRIMRAREIRHAFR